MLIVECRLSKRPVNRELLRQSTFHNPRSKRNIIVLELLFFGERRFLWRRALGAALGRRTAALWGRAAAARRGLFVVAAALLFVSTTATARASAAELKPHLCSGDGRSVGSDR